MGNRESAKFTLEPCPFCNGTAQKFRSWHVPNRAFVRCINCGAKVEANDDNDAVGMAVRKWNTRHQVSNPVDYSAELAEIRSQCKYALADVQNMKKRTAKEIDDAVFLQKKAMLLQFLKIYDSLGGMLGLTRGGNSKDVVASVPIVHKTMELMLRDIGVEEIRVNVGDKFDHDIHNAIQTAFVCDRTPDTVVSVFNNAWKLDGKVIRHANVVVAK